MTRSFASPLAFKTSLEQRLQASAPSGAKFAHHRRLLVFDRFLARVVDVMGNAMTLKGGLALELRIASDPVLAGNLDAAWDPAAWRWNPT